MIVVDTNVVSELMRRARSPIVAAWVRSRRPEVLHTTAVTLAEVRYGIERLPEGRRRSALDDVANEVFGAFAERVLPFDAAAAEHYAEIKSARDARGTPIDAFDAQIAAICRAHGATLATRNVKDFTATGVPVLNPWET